MLKICACDMGMQMLGVLVRTKIRDHRRRTVVSFDCGGDVSDHNQQFGSALHQWPSGLSVRRCGTWALRRCGQTSSAIAMHARCSAGVETCLGVSLHGIRDSIQVDRIHLRHVCHGKPGDVHALVVRDVASA